MTAIAKLRAALIPAAAIALGAMVAPTQAQVGGGARPDLAFEGINGQVEILAEQRLERAAKLMKGVGAMRPRDDLTGLAGAGEPAGMSGWIAMGGVSLGSRIPGAEYNGYQVNGVAGMDYAVQPWLILGVSAGVEARDLTTDFNLGRLESNGGTIAPYFIARLDENYFVEGTFSYTRLVNDLVRNDYPFGTQAAGEYGSNRYAGIVNLHGVWNIDNWRLGATFGYLHVRQDDEAYIEKAFCGFDCSSSIPGKTSDLGQLRGGGRIGYAFGDFIPYVIGRVEYDAIKPTLFGVSVNDRVGGFVGAGFRWNIARAITLSAQGNTIVGRERQTNYGGYATVRYSW